MKKNTEVVSCKDSKGAEATKVVQTEQKVDHFELLLKCVTKISMMAAGTVLILNIGIYKLVALLLFIFFFSLSYFGFKN